MVAGKLPPNKYLEFDQGGHWDAVFTCYSTFVALGDPGNVLADLTGYHAALSFRSPTSEDTQIFKATDGDYLAMGGAGGTVTLSVPKSDTTTVQAFAEGFFELQLTPPAGDDSTVTVLTGKVVVRRWGNR